MPELLPFRAVRFTGLTDLSSRIAQPYDVLDEQPKQQLLQRDPHNIVKIDLPVTPPKTVGPDAAYDQAGETYRRWIAEGVLQQEDRPALYAYEQRFTLHGKPVARRGIFALLGVEEFNRPNGGIFRHEHTIRGGTDDRMKLMTATAAQLSPVFAVYEDAGAAITRLLQPTFDAPPHQIATTANDGVEHRLWVVDDVKTITAIAKQMHATDVFIADGHHRYTTALNYRKAHADRPEAAGCLFLLVAMQDPGLDVLPTHRVLCGLEKFSIDALRDVLTKEGRFVLEPAAEGAAGLTKLEASLPAQPHHAVGIFDGATGKSYRLRTKEADPLARDLPEQPAVWRTLDVAVFHELLVDRLIRPHFGGAAIHYQYPHQLESLRTQCAGHRDRLGAILQPTPLQSVCDVATAGGVMPPKSTFFYPKVATGLVIHTLTEINSHINA